MQYLHISSFSSDALNKIIDFVGKTCDKIFLTELSTENGKTLIGELKEYILDFKRVTVWDGTEIGADEDCKDGIIPEEVQPIQHLIKCNDETIEIIKKYSNLKKRGLFSRDSYFDIAFYNGDNCCFFTTAHEDSICFNKEFYKMAKKNIDINKEDKSISK